MFRKNPFRPAPLPKTSPTLAEELNKLVNDITLLGYRVSDLLNRHLDAGDLTEEQLNGLRLIAAAIGEANSEAFEQYKNAQ